HSPAHHPFPTRRSSDLSGVLARRLVAAGYAVVGIDHSPSMIRIARATAPGAQFRVASLEHVRLPRAKAVIAIGEIVTYVRGGVRSEEHTSELQSRVDLV